VIRVRMIWASDWGQYTPECPDPDSPAALAADKAAGGGTKLVCTCYEESGKLIDTPFAKKSTRLIQGATTLDPKAPLAALHPPGHPGCVTYRVKFQWR
jgi:hypothetical protein